VTLPAGEVTISDIADHGSSSVLVIRAASGESVEALAGRIDVPNNARSNEARVVFRHTGDKYQMEKIWMLGRDYGYEIAPTPEHE